VKSWQSHDRDLLSWAEINFKETARFTKTGQRSIIDNALAKTEVENLKLELTTLAKWEESLRAQMKLFGVEADCKHLSASWQVGVPENLRVHDPAMLMAKGLGGVAEAAVREARAAQLPLLKAMGSVGAMERTRLVSEQNYSAGVGLVLPIWNGGEDAKREEGYKSEAEFEVQQLKAAEQEFQVKLKSLHDEFDRSRAAFTMLENNLKDVRSTMKLASARYRRLEGPLIDVREAFKQLRAMELERLQMMQNLGLTALQTGLYLQN
jgi:outer membrane protein TolC